MNGETGYLTEELSKESGEKEAWFLLTVYDKF